MARRVGLFLCHTRGHGRNGIDLTALTGRAAVNGVGCEIGLERSDRMSIMLALSEFFFQDATSLATIGA